MNIHKYEKAVKTKNIQMEMSRNLKRSDKIERKITQKEKRRTKKEKRTHP